MSHLNDVFSCCCARTSDAYVPNFVYPLDSLASASSVPYFLFIFSSVLFHLSRFSPRPHSPIAEEVFKAIAQQLRSLTFLTIEQRTGEREWYITLNIPQDDIPYAFREDELCASLVQY